MEKIANMVFVEGSAFPIAPLAGAAALIE